jgi:hypothetical protein
MSETPSKKIIRVELMMHSPQDQGNESLLDAANGADVPADADDLQPLPRLPFVEIAGVPLSKDVLMLIALHLSVKDFVSLTRVNYALHESLNSPRIHDNLYVRIPGVVGYFTMHDIAAMLQQQFPEQAWQERLNECARCCSNCEACCMSDNCMMMTVFVSGLTSLPVAVNAEVAISHYLATQTAASACGAGVLSISGAIGAGCLTFTGICGGYGLLYSTVVKCDQAATNRARQHQQMMQTDPRIKDKATIFGLFKTRHRDIAKVRLYPRAESLPNRLTMGS